MKKTSVFVEKNLFLKENPAKTDFLFYFFKKGIAQQKDVCYNADEESKYRGGEYRCGS